MDILLIDEKIKNNLKYTEELKFYFLDTSHIIEKYKKILSKPILRSEETSHKSDIIEEYIKEIRKYYKYFYLAPSVIEILYYRKYHRNPKTPCENCNGTNFIKCIDFITCEDCGCFTKRINFINSCSDIGRVNLRNVNKKKLIDFNL